MWRNESVSVKNHWKRLADEENRRHKELHPGYKYTARRSPANQTNTIQNIKRGPETWAVGDLVGEVRARETK